MKFFIDTANVDEIRKANDMGISAKCTRNFGRSVALIV